MLSKALRSPSAPIVWRMRQATSPVYWDSSITPQRESWQVLALGTLGDGAASVTAPLAIARKRHRLVKGAKIMLRTLNCPVIALEEHYWDKELAALFVGVEGVRDPEILKRR